MTEATGEDNIIVTWSHEDVGTLYNLLNNYYNIMGPLSYMRSVVDRNVVMRRIPVYIRMQDVLLNVTERIT
jgi:hypothetical protein